MRSLFAPILFFTSIIASAAQAAPERILVSIKPLALIVAELADGVAGVEVLLPPNASPHDFTLRPSDRKLLGETPFLVWLGPELEPYLPKVIAASKTPNFAWQAGDSDQAMTGDDHDHDHGHDHDAAPVDPHSGHGHEDDEHGHHDSDLHPWLSPEQVADFAREFSHQLEARYPAQSDLLEQNLSQFLDSLNRVDQENAALLAEVRDQGFVVFHDAYGALVEHYGLNQVGYFMLDPARKPGARHLAEIREHLEEDDVRCVFVEPQFSASMLEAITKDLDINQGVLDPLAIDQPLGRGSYAGFLRALVLEINNCLQSN